MYFELEYSFTEKELKSEFRRLSKLYHPDIIGGDGKVFLEVQKEYEELKSGKIKPEKKVVKKKINRWKFYEFFSMDTDVISFYLNPEAFTEGATVFLMEKSGGKEIRISLPPNSKAPMKSSFMYAGRIFEVSAELQRRSRTTF